MRKTLFAATAGLVAAGFVQNALAVCVDESVHYIRSGYRENVQWPWPYVCSDRIAVREPFALMVNNGWRRQNLLGPHHFNAKADKLTSAGQLRVHWVMTQAPPERREIFIERALEPQITQQRMATVRDYAAQVGLDAMPPRVSETHLVSEGRPAAVVDATNVRFQESMPPPMLPAATVGTGSTQ